MMWVARSRHVSNWKMISISVCIWSQLGRTSHTDLRLNLGYLRGDHSRPMIPREPNRRAERYADPHVRKATTQNRTQSNFRQKERGRLFIKARGISRRLCSLFALMSGHSSPGRSFLLATTNRRVRSSSNLLDTELLFITSSTLNMARCLWRAK